MTAFLEVVRPGFSTTVQDLGRHGYLSQGVTPAGALDGPSLRVANALVGNRASAAGLEMAVQGGEFLVAADSARLAVAGADCAVEILPEEGPPEPLPLWRSARLRRGDRLRVGRLTGGAVAYLAVAGGIEVAPVLGSRSTYARAGMGGFEGRTLQAGDLLPLARPTVEPATETMLAGEPGWLDPTRPIRVVLGPQDHAFTQAGIETFLSEPFTVTRESDRMGLRLSGAEIEHAETYEIASDGIAPGAIQVPGSRQPLILLAERLTVGGYTKIATVISADLPRVDQARPDTVLRFEAVTVEAAEALRREQELEIGALIAGRRAAVPAGTLDEAVLESLDLASGYVD